MGSSRSPARRSRSRSAPRSSGDSPSSRRGKSGSGRPRTRSKSGSPDSRARTRSRSPRSRDRSRSRPRRRRSRSRSRRRSPRRYSISPRSRRSRSPSVDEMEGQRLHVADLDSHATKRDLEDIFTKYGSLVEIWMARSVPCFAFVVFKHKEDAYEACRAADGQEVCGRRVRVTMAKPRTRGRGRRGFDPSMRCYQCGERGHFSRDCPDSKYGYKRPPSPRQRGRFGGRSRSRDRYRSRSRDRYRSRSRGRRY